MRARQYKVQQYNDALFSSITCCTRIYPPQYLTRGDGLCNHPPPMLCISDRWQTCFEHHFKHFKEAYYLPLKNRIILCKHFKVSSEDLQCIDLFGINQNVAQKYSPNCAIQFSKFKNLPASEGGGSF